MSQDNPRIAVLGFAIECNRFSPVTTAEDFEHDVDIRGNRIVSEARSANRSPCRICRLLRRDGSHRQLDAGSPAGLAGPARRPGRGAVLQGLSRRDRGRPEVGAAGRCDLRLLPRRGARPGHRRSRWRPVRDPAPRRGPRRAHRVGVRPARQRLAPHDRQSQRLRGLSREPACRHLRTRRRGGHAHARAAGGHAHGDRNGEAAAGPAADFAADGKGPLRGPHPLRPDQGGWRHPQRLRDGGLRLQRQPQERSDRPSSRRATATARPPPTSPSTSPNGPGACGNASSAR